MKDKSYWKGKPKLQGWYKSPQDEQAVRAAFEEAKGAGRTRARAPGGWVTEWIVDASRVAARGGLAPAAAPAGHDDEELRAAQQLVREHYGIADPADLERRLVLLTARALRSGRDPFGVRLKLAHAAGAES